MKNFTALLGTIAALALVPTVANAAAVVIPIGTYATPGSPDHFYITSDPTDLTSVASDFGATTTGKNVAFDYAFTFTLPYDGTGSGSLSTSFAGKTSKIDITSVIIDSVAYTPVSTGGGYSLVVTGIPIMAGALNTIEVIGTTGPSNKTGTFTGTATFEASAVPEPATWATFLLGFGFMGMAVRRKLSTKLKTA